MDPPGKSPENARGLATVPGRPSCRSWAMHRCPGRHHGRNPRGPQTVGSGAFRRGRPETHRSPSPAPPHPTPHPRNPGETVSGVAAWPLCPVPTSRERERGPGRTPRSGPLSRKSFSKTTRGPNAGPLRPRRSFFPGRRFPGAHINRAAPSSPARLLAHRPPPRSSPGRKTTRPARADCVGRCFFIEADAVLASGSSARLPPLAIRPIRRRPGIQPWLPPGRSPHPHRVHSATHPPPPPRAASGQPPAARRLPRNPRGTANPGIAALLGLKPSCLGPPRDPPAAAASPKPPEARPARCELAPRQPKARRSGPAT